MTGRVLLIVCTWLLYLCRGAGEIQPQLHPLVASDDLPIGFRLGVGLGQEDAFHVANPPHAISASTSTVFNVYGNEWQEAHRLFNLTVKLDVQDYFNDFNLCYNAPRVGRCNQLINGWHRPLATLWTPAINTTDHHHRRNKDCEYAVVPVSRRIMVGRVT
jgi:hypothetical protein